MPDKPNRISATSPVYLEQEMSGRVLWITMCQPDKGNALSLAAMEALRHAIGGAYLDRRVKVIVLAAKGRIYCAGHDVYEMVGDKNTEDTRIDQLRVLEACKQLMLTIMHGDKPVIACVQGIATAGGTQLVSTCDLAIAADTAVFCTPGVNLGAFCTTPLIGVGRNMHRKHAMEMALTGETFSAEDAVRFGLINRAVPCSRLRDETEALAQKIATRSGEGIRQGKKAFYDQIEMPIEQAYLFGIEKMIDACSTVDARRGFIAFQTRTKPVWQDEE
jgi:enoyl-CoA hydratase/carnithine racemase